MRQCAPSRLAVDSVDGQAVEAGFRRPRSGCAAPRWFGIRGPERRAVLAAAVPERRRGRAAAGYGAMPGCEVSRHPMSNKPHVVLRSPHAHPADAGQDRRRAARRARLPVRAEVGRLPRDRLPQRRADAAAEPRPEAAEPLLPRARAGAARRAAEGLRARRRDRRRVAARARLRRAAAAHPPGGVAHREARARRRRRASSRSTCSAPAASRRWSCRSPSGACGSSGCWAARSRRCT